MSCIGHAESDALLERAGLMLPGIGYKLRDLATVLQPSCVGSIRNTSGRLDRRMYLKSFGKLDTLGGGP